MKCWQSLLILLLASTTFCGSSADVNNSSSDTISNESISSTDSNSESVEPSGRLSDSDDDYCKPVPCSGAGCCQRGSRVPPEVPHDDEPEYELVSNVYEHIVNDTAEDNGSTVYSSFLICHRVDVIRNTFGNPVQRPESHAIPINWSLFLSIRLTVFPKVLLQRFLSHTLPLWPEAIIPFIYPLLAIAIALITIIPMFILGGILWALVFQLRILGHKKIRMLVRSWLIRMEKVRRYRFERSFPLQHLRKFRERDRYQMPKAFQDSDLSDDDEPVELTREEIPRERTTMWSDAQIELYGFDPDNIPMDWVYGDLLGDASKLAPEVKDYVSKRKKKGHQVDDFDDDSLNSAEWADFLRNKITEKMHREKELFLQSLQSKIAFNMKPEVQAKDK